MTKTSAQLDHDIVKAVPPAGFVAFHSWEDVLKAARSHEPLYYKAPMDHRPRSVRVAKVFVNGKVRIDPMSNDADFFTADKAHVARFFRRA